MQIKYSPHGKKRLLERKITEAEVLLTLVESDNKVHSGRNRVIANKKFKDYTLEVVYVIENNQIIVITLYYL